MTSKLAARIPEYLQRWDSRPQPIDFRQVLRRPIEAAIINGRCLLSAAAERLSK
jgi:hypothetical protein